MITIDELIKLESHPCAIKKTSEPELLNSIKEDISFIGLIYPILIADGKILDGVKRQQAIAELYAENRLPENFELKVNELTCTAEDGVTSGNLLRETYNSFERAMIGVSLYFDKYEKEAEIRGNGGVKVDSAEKGTTAEKIANKVGTNRQYVGYCSGLWKFSPDTVGCVLRGQLHYDTAAKFNNMPENKKKKYLDWFNEHPDANHNFDNAQEHFKENTVDKKESEKQEKQNERASEEWTEDLPIFGMFTQAVAPEFIDRVNALAREYQYINGLGVIWTASDTKQAQTALESLRDELMLDVHVIEPTKLMTSKCCVSTPRLALAPRKRKAA